MANVDRPFGFRAVQNVAGTAPEIRHFSATTNTTFYQGQPVALADTGLLVAWTTTTAVTGNTVGVAMYGVTGAAGSATPDVAVYVDPDQVYEVQSDDSSLTVATDYLGALARTVNHSAGNATLLRSSGELDGSSATSVTGKAATNVAPLHILDIADGIDNEIGSSISWTRFKVKFIPSVHLYGSPTIGLAAATNLYTGVL